MQKVDNQGRALYLDKNNIETTASIYHIPVTVTREYEVQFTTQETTNETGETVVEQVATGKYYKPVFEAGQIISFDLVDEVGSYEIQVDTVEENKVIEV